MMYKGDELRTKKDLLTLMMEIQDDEGNKLSVEEIVDLIITFLLAVHESFGHDVTWAIIFLHENPEKGQGPVSEEGSCFISFTTPEMSGSDAVHHALINKRLVNEDYEHCDTKRFHLEPPNFYYSGGQVSLVIQSMPYDLLSLFSGLSEDKFDFKMNVRTYNNSLAFTSLGAKYDHELTKNSKGVYTFHVQGQVYHILNGLEPSAEEPSGIQLYFFDTEEELSRRLYSSPKLRESTMKLLMNVLGQIPHAKFFKGISLATRNDSVFLIDPPKREARQLENWCRFDVDLTIESGTITASVIADLRETLLGFNAPEAMSLNNNIQTLNQDSFYVSFCNRHILFCRTKSFY
ncbi:hypothetical protein ACH5RR_040450 [Cinchona calisaya]|uniref:Uncharacterized protein n=1 Tax=Cinchona calisaya TaxID=153742 RepID=A0ABD2XW52_9GENT